MANKPRIRFKGFTEDWEQRKLNDFGIATGGTSIESEFVDGGTYKVISIGSYSEESVYNDQGLRVNKTDKTKFRILNKDDLTMILNDKTASGNIIGRVLLIDQDNTYVYNQRTERIEVDTKNFLPMFLYHMLNAPEQRKYIVKASQGNTQIYVNWSTINNIDYMIPQLLLEQEKIANLFSLINKDITLHQCKLEKLKLTKKALLQKLFPKNGKHIPEIRFKGFTDAWEQRKFGDLFEYERPDAYIVKSDNYNNDFNMPVLTANKAFILGYTNEENSYNKPSIIFDDFTLDRKYVDFPYMLKSSAIKILTSKNQHNLRFLFERLNSTRFEVLGHARHYISVVQNTTTLCPSIDEEVCISNLLTKFDELITLHQRKLDHLQLQKKALLQQMFV